MLGTPHSHGMVMSRRTQLVKFLQRASRSGSVAFCLCASGLQAADYYQNYAPTQNQRIVEPRQNYGGLSSDLRVASAPARTALPASSSADQAVMMAQPIAIPSNLPPGTQFILVPVQSMNGSAGMVIPNGMPAVPVANSAATIPTGTTSPATPNYSFNSQTTNADSLRPEQLSGLNQQVQQVGARGWRLAERNALFASRQKFEEALQLAAHGIDGQLGGNRHGRALADAFLAFKEAEDFATRPDDILAERDVARLTQLHRTPVLKNGSPGIPNVMALQAYYRYGRQQLVLAMGPLPAAADALHGLGKVHTFLAKEEGATNELHFARAIAYQQSALDINPRQSRAAHELGVLLAMHGQWQDARQALIKSLRTQPRPETWHNLAIVHQRLGEGDLAQRAEWERAQLAGPASPQTSAIASGVQWIDPSQFARQSMPPGAQPNNIPPNSNLTNAPRPAPVSSAQAPPRPGYYPR